MKPFIKTLIGDVRNLLAVAAALAMTASLSALGEPRAAWILLPALLLAAVAWLARR